MSTEGPLKVSEANLVVYVHPSKASNVSQAISTELSSHIFKYNHTFDGVLLAYEVSIVEKLAKILSGIIPYFGVRLKAQLLLFYPKPDMALEGKVVKIGERSIHVIVLGFASAIITEEDIREEFNYKVKHDEEVFSSAVHKSHMIKKGTFIRFIVKSFDEERLHIMGSLLPSNTGSIKWLRKHVDDSQVESNIKQQEVSLEDAEMLKHDKVMADEQTLSPKKSKKRRIGD